MRNVILSLIFLGLTGYGAKIAYDKFNLNKDTLLGMSYEYPDQIKVTNAKGKAISITLLGRDEKYLKFRNDAGKEFVYSIDSLSDQSQALVMKYPESGMTGIDAHLSSGNVELNDVYVRQLKDEIEKKQKEISNLVMKSSAESSDAGRRTYERKIERIQSEIADLESKIATR